MAKHHVWESKWEFIDNLGNGGQGYTILVQNMDNDKLMGALKFLKSQKDPERRERLYREMAALKTLDHENIPKLIDGNGEEYADNSIELYIVTEYIPGDTLEKFIEKRGILSFQDATELILSLAHTLKYCHDREFVHRDIKPNNIILRDNDLKSPVLIDYGLSFNREIAAEVNSTETGQHIGNRFLSLPELRVPGANKRDPRSDITMLCGIFLYSMTGIIPTDLLDENEAKPHRRDLTKEKLANVAGPAIDLLNNFFDKAFNPAINDRYQSIDSVIKRLEELLNFKPQEMKDEDRAAAVEAIKRKLNASVDVEKSNNLKKFFDDLDNAIRRGITQVLNQFKELDFHSLQSAGHTDIPHQLYRNTFGIGSGILNRELIRTIFKCRGNGSEFILDATSDGETVELDRIDWNDHVDWGSIEERVSEYYIRGIQKKLES